METIRLMDRQLKVRIRSDQEALTLHGNVRRRLGAAACDRAREMAEMDSEITFQVLVDRGIFIDSRTKDKAYGYKRDNSTE